MLRYFGGNRDKKVVDRHEFFNLDFHGEMETLYRATTPKVIEMACRDAFKRAARTVVTGVNSVAAKAAFGRGGRYAIPKRVAMDKGQWRAGFHWMGQHGFGGKDAYTGAATLSGKAIGLHNFPHTIVERKVPIGPKQLPGKRKVLRLRVLKSSGLKVPRPDGSKNFPKRWAAKYPLEFGGFVAKGNAGRVKAGGKDLIFRRAKKPGSPGSRADREPIVSMYTLNPANMMISKATWPKLDKAFAERLPLEMVRRLEYYSERAAFRSLPVGPLGDN